MEKELNIRDNTLERLEVVRCRDCRLCRPIKYIHDEDWNICEPDGDWKHVTDDLRSCFNFEAKVSARFEWRCDLCNGIAKKGNMTQRNENIIYHWICSECGSEKVRSVRVDNIETPKPDPQDERDYDCCECRFDDNVNEEVCPFRESCGETSICEKGKWEPRSCGACVHLDLDHSIKRRFESKGDAFKCHKHRYSLYTKDYINEDCTEFRNRVDRDVSKPSKPVDEPKNCSTCFGFTIDEMCLWNLKTFERCQRKKGWRERKAQCKICYLEKNCTNTSDLYEHDCKEFRCLHPEAKPLKTEAQRLVDESIKLNVELMKEQSEQYRQQLEMLSNHTTLLNKQEKEIPKDLLKSLNCEFCKYNGFKCDKEWDYTKHGKQCKRFKKRNVCVECKHSIIIKWFDVNQHPLIKNPLVKCTFGKGFSEYNGFSNIKCDSYCLDVDKLRKVNEMYFVFLGKEESKNIHTCGECGIISDWGEWGNKHSPTELCEKCWDKKYKLTLNLVQPPITHTIEDFEIDQENYEKLMECGKNGEVIEIDGAYKCVGMLISIRRIILDNHNLRIGTLKIQEVSNYPQEPIKIIIKRPNKKEVSESPYDECKDCENLTDCKKIDYNVICLSGIEVSEMDDIYKLSELDRAIINDIKNKNEVNNMEKKATSVFEGLTYEEIQAKLEKLEEKRKKENEIRSEYLYKKFYPKAFYDKDFIKYLKLKKFSRKNLKILVYICKFDSYKTLIYNKEYYEDLTKDQLDLVEKAIEHQEPYLKQKAIEELCRIAPNCQEVLEHMRQQKQEKQRGKVCPQCKGKVRRRATFCTQCGHRVGGVEEQ